MPGPAVNGNLEALTTARPARAAAPRDGGLVDDGKSTLIGRLLYDSKRSSRTSSSRSPRPPSAATAATATSTWRC